jgi:hypothetical protein
MRVWVQKYEADAAVTLAAKAIAGQGGLFGDVAETQGAALEKLRAVVWRERASDACPRPHEAYNVVTAPHERAHRRTTDGASGAQDEHSFCVRGPNCHWRRRDINHRLALSANVKPLGSGAVISNAGTVHPG